MSLIFPLRSHVIPEAKALALKLTLLSDIAFAGLTERTMAIAPHTMESILTELCRFIIDAAEAAREIAPCRTPELAAYELACVNAAIDTLRHAIAMRDRQPARGPLQEVAHRLGLPIDENDPDWQRLAFRALRVMVEAQEENLSREQGIYAGSTQYRTQPNQPMAQLQRTAIASAPFPQQSLPLRCMHTNWLLTLPPLRELPLANLRPLLPFPKVLQQQNPLLTCRCRNTLIRDVKSMPLQNTMSI